MTLFKEGNPTRQMPELRIKQDAKSASESWEVFPTHFDVPATSDGITYSSAQMEQSQFYRIGSGQMGAIMNEGQSPKQGAFKKGLNPKGILPTGNIR